MDLKRYLQDYLMLFLIAGVIVVLDQLTKSWIRQNLLIGEVYRPDLWISNYARIVNWKNTGAAFGMFQSLGGVFTVLSFIVGGVILYYFPQISREDWLIRLSMAMLLGGAIGNLIDRLTQGYVTDFISVGNFPVFNVADSSISVGVAVLFIGMWVQERRKKSGPDPAVQEPPGSEASGIPEEMQGE
jgi:signal peptidase II